MLFMGKCSKEDFVKSKRRFYVVGAIMLALGFVSLSMPLLASFAVETMIGCLLLAVGLGSAFGAFSAMRSGDSPWQQAFMAVISVAAGVVFLTHPLAGVMTLTQRAARPRMAEACDFRSCVRVGLNGVRVLCFVRVAILSSDGGNRHEDTGQRVSSRLEVPLRRRREARRARHRARRGA